LAPSSWFVENQRQLIQDFERLLKPLQQADAHHDDPDAAPFVGCGGGGSGGHQEKRLVVQGAKEEAPEITECPNVLARPKVDDDDQ
jgi:hypothetical protein